MVYTVTNKKEWPLEVPLLREAGVVGGDSRKKET